MKKKDIEIQPLNDDVLGNISIEELEERLELQILHMTEAQQCYDCLVNIKCGTNCFIDLFARPELPSLSQPIPSVFECTEHCPFLGCPTLA